MNDENIVEYVHLMLGLPHKDINEKSMEYIDMSIQTSQLFLDNTCLRLGCEKLPADHELRRITAVSFAQETLADEVLYGGSDDPETIREALDLHGESHIGRFECIEMLKSYIDETPETDGDE